jgi:S1-C subfamily serine protease
MTSSLLPQLSSELDTLIEALTPRIVAVSAARHVALSGILWRDRYVVTAAEAVAGSERVRLRWSRSASVSRSEQQGGQAGPPEPPAETVGALQAADLSTDVAVIVSETAIERATGRAGADASSAGTQPGMLRLGERVLIMAHDGRGPLVTWGTIYAAGPAWRSRRGGEIAQRLEVDALRDRRLEGALVADTQGGIAGMLVSGPRNWLAIPAATVERVLDSVARHGYLPRPYLGVRLQNLWLDAGTLGRFGRQAMRIAVVAGVDADSPAAAAQLEPGDLIDSVDGREADGVDAVTALLSATTPGKRLDIGMRRGGTLVTRTLTVGERPSAAGRPGAREAGK